MFVVGHLSDMIWDYLITNQFGLVNGSPEDQHNNDLTPYLDLSDNFLKKTVNILCILQKKVKFIRRRVTAGDYNDVFEDFYSPRTELINYHICT
jgi:hypothetical protein